MHFDDEFDKTLVSRKPWENDLKAGKSALKKGKIKDAEAYLNKALEEAIKFGDDDPRIGNINSTLADLYNQKQDYNQAELFYQKSISIWSKAFGDDYFGLIDIMNKYHEVLIKVGKHSEAEKIQKRIKEINKINDRSISRH